MSDAPEEGTHAWAEAWLAHLNERLPTLPEINEDLKRQWAELPGDTPVVLSKTSFEGLLTLLREISASSVKATQVASALFAGDRDAAKRNFEDLVFETLRQEQQTHAIWRLTVSEKLEVEDDE